ncbi:MAG: hypothetical protein RLZZ141_471 [Pseudomonadota bacterium]
MARVAQRSNLQLIAMGLRFGWSHPLTARFRGGMTMALGLALILAFASYNASDPSFNAATGGAPTNLLGTLGAGIADAAIQSLGLAAWAGALLMVAAGLWRVGAREPDETRGIIRLRSLVGLIGALALAGILAAAPTPASWPLASGLGGFWGESLLHHLGNLFGLIHVPGGRIIAAVLLSVGAITALGFGSGITKDMVGRAVLTLRSSLAEQARRRAEQPATKVLATPKPRATRPARARSAAALDEGLAVNLDDELDAPPEAAPQVLNIKAPKTSNREQRENQKAFDFVQPGGFQLPELAMLAKPKPRSSAFDEGSLRQNARMLESVLAEFGVKGQIDQIRPGPVVTLYELVPAPGVKHARVVALSDDIARSMSARACRVAVVQGRNAIGIELPNSHRETVYLRDLLASSEYEKSSQILPMALGETIGGEPYIADMSKMPHLLIAGTTGSGKSVGVNAMILSILYRLPPDKCKFIMIDPKMLELSVYDGIPHLLAPVVTDPKKAIVALKWTVREMEDRYRRMSKIGVRNIGGFNEKANEALAKGEHFVRTVQTGFDEAGRPVYEEEKLRPDPMPYLVVVIDEVADLMMVAGKDIEGAVQRLAQMARAAGIHPPSAPRSMSLPAPSRPTSPPGSAFRSPPRSTAARSWASRVPSNCWARATCSIWPGADGSRAFTGPLSLTEKLRRSRPFCAVKASRNISKRSPPAMTRMAVTATEAAKAACPAMISMIGPSLWSPATARPRPAISSAACRSVITGRHP